MILIFKMELDAAAYEYQAESGKPISFNIDISKA
jgi:hypothetical protein